MTTTSPNLAADADALALAWEKRFFSESMLAERDKQYALATLLYAASERADALREVGKALATMRDDAASEAERFQKRGMDYASPLFPPSAERFTRAVAKLNSKTEAIKLLSRVAAKAGEFPQGCDDLASLRAYVLGVDGTEPE